MTIVCEEYPHVRSVSLGVWVKVGSSVEKNKQNGISHFIEHMVFKGTKSRNALEISTAIESVGGELNAFTERELTCFHSTVLSENLDIALDVLGELVTTPNFEKQEIERERGVLLQELAMSLDSPEECLLDTYLQLVWGKEGLGQPIIGTKKSISKISRQNLLSFFHSHYAPKNVVLSIAGNVKFSELVEKCEKYFQFSSLSDGVPFQAQSPTYKARKKVIKSDTEQVYLVSGFESTGMNDPLRFAALLLSFVLGGGMSSRLFQKVRENAGLAYSIDCDFSPYLKTGLFSIFVNLNAKSLKECLKILGSELNKIKTTPVEKKELEQIKGQLRGAILLSSDQMEVRQEALARNEIYFGTYFAATDILSCLEKVTASQILEVSERMFTEEKESLIVLSRKEPTLKKMSVF